MLMLRSLVLLFNVLLLSDSVRRKDITKNITDMGKGFKHYINIFRVFAKKKKVRELSVFKIRILYNFLRNGFNQGKLLGQIHFIYYFLTQLFLECFLFLLFNHLFMSLFGIFDVLLDILFLQFIFSLFFCFSSPLLLVFPSFLKFLLSQCYFH